MKIILTAIIALISFSATAQTIVSPDSAKYNIGSLATICGKVGGTHATKGGKVFLNFGNPFPDQSFTAIFQDSLFTDATFSAESLKGKNVCVIGKIVDYKGKPEIHIKSKEQLRLQ